MKNILKVSILEPFLVFWRMKNPKAFLHRLHEIILTITESLYGNTQYCSCYTIQIYLQYCSLRSLFDILLQSCKRGYSMTETISSSIADHKFCQHLSISLFYLIVQYWRRRRNTRVGSIVIFLHLCQDLCDS